MMNDCFIKLCRYRVGKYWKRCRRAICLELHFTNTCILSELVFAKAALPSSLSVEKWCSCKCICLLPCVCGIWILLHHTVSENSLSQEANILTITL